MRKHHLIIEQTSPEAKKTLKNSFEGDLGINLQAYKILEVIFRQALMQSPSTGYRFTEPEQVDENLMNEDLPHADRLQMISQYVARWEREIGGDAEYGFEGLNVDKFEFAENVTNQYLLDLERLEEWADQATSVTDEMIDDFKKQMKERLEAEVGVAGRPPGKLLEFDTNYKVKVKIENYEYFKNYIGFACGVFSGYVDRNSRPGESKINYFISSKLSYELNHNEVNTLFTPKKIGDRWRKNIESNRKRSNIPREMGLITEDFIDYIIDHYE